MAKYKPTAREYFGDNMQQLKHKSGVEDRGQLHINLRAILTAGNNELKQIVKSRPEIKSIVDDVVRLRVSNPTMSADVIKELEEEVRYDERAKRPDPPFHLTNRLTITLQGDSRGLRQKGILHTPTIAEIIANANKPDPTATHFDPNSDHMRQIDPRAPHYNLSGDFPTLVNPLKTGPRISNLG